MMGFHGLATRTDSSSSRHSGVFGLLSALQILMTSTDLRVGASHWFSETLRIMGDMYGIGQAIVLRSSLQA